MFRYSYFHTLRQYWWIRYFCRCLPPFWIFSISCQVWILRAVTTSYWWSRGGILSPKYVALSSSWRSLVPLSFPSGTSYCSRLSPGPNSARQSIPVGCEKQHRRVDLKGKFGLRVFAQALLDVLIWCLLLHSSDAASEEAAHDRNHEWELRRRNGWSNPTGMACRTLTCRKTANLDSLLYETARFSQAFLWLL